MEFCQLKIKSGLLFNNLKFKSGLFEYAMI